MGAGVPGRGAGRGPYGATADRIVDAEHAAKTRVLATLELRTKEAVAPALARAELAGDTATSLDPVNALAHMR